MSTRNLAEMSWRQLERDLKRTRATLRDLEAVARRMRADRILWSAKRCAGAMSREEFDKLMVGQAALRAAVTQGLTDGEERLRAIREERRNPRFDRKHVAKWDCAE